VLKPRPDPDDFDALVRRSWPMVRGIARDYEIPGMTVEDVEQEGLVALMEAARNFDRSRGVPFAAFANTVIRLRLSDARTKATRQKHEPLNAAITTVVNDDGAELELLELIADRSPSPDAVAASREALRDLALAIEHDLSEAERIAIRGVTNGVPYDELARRLRVPAGRRYVDNCVQRARRKLRAVAERSVIRPL